MPTPLEEIAKLQQQIAQLTGAAVEELNARRTRLQEELSFVEAELEKFTGKPAKVKRPRALPSGGGPVPYGPMSSSPAPTSGKRPDLQELKALLVEAPGKTINLRKGGYDLGNVKIMAEANPHLLRMGGKGAWPEVTLLKW